MALGHFLQQILGLRRYPGVCRKTPFRLAVVGEGEVRVGIPFVAYLVCGPLISPAHELGLADKCLMIEYIKDRQKGFVILFSEHFSEPFGPVCRSTLIVERIYVVCH